MQGSRIPAKESASYGAWNLPEVRDGEVVQVEKLKQRGPRGQLINVGKDEVIYSSLTAAQLEDISNQAYEEVRQQAYQDGLKQGRTAGYQKGLDSGQQAVQQQLASLNKTVSELLRYLGGQDDEVEQALVNMATCVASAVLRRELTIDSAHIGQVVNEAIAALPMEASNITVHLSEQDYQLLTTQTDIPEQWQLQIDRTLSPGGCRVQSQHSIVDYTLEEQFQQTVNGLVERRFAELGMRAKQRADDSVDNLVEDSIDNPVEDFVDNPVEDSVYDSVEDSVYDPVEDSVDDPVEDSVYDSVEDSVDDSVEKKGSPPESLGG
ncbi:MAG: FliH/SctL family protein [Pseudomonadales bacterium]